MEDGLPSCGGYYWCYWCPAQILFVGQCRHVPDSVCVGSLAVCNYPLPRGNCPPLKESSLALAVMPPLPHINDRLTGVETKKLGPCFKVGPAIWFNSCSRALGGIRLSQTPVWPNMGLAFFLCLTPFPFLPFCWEHSFSKSAHPNLGRLCPQ